MQTLNQHEKAIRYLGIAVVVISALALIGVIIGFILMAVGQAALNAYGPDLIQQGYSYGHVHHGSGYYGELSAGDAMGLANFGMGLGYAALVWELVTAVVSLIAGILAIRGAADRDKLGSVFGWGIAGAIAAFLGGRLVTCVLMVIVAVFASKDKSAPAWPQAGYVAGAPGYGAVQPQAPAAGGWAAPAAGYGAVAAQAATPSAPAVDPQAQAYQTAYQQSYGAPVAAAQPSVGYAAPVAGATVAAAAAPGAAQAAAAVNAAESGEAARAAQEYAAGVMSVEAADVANLAANAAEAEAAATAVAEAVVAAEPVDAVVEAVVEEDAEAGKPQA